MDKRLFVLAKESEIFVKPYRDRAELAEAKVNSLQKQLDFITSHVTTSLLSWPNWVISESVDITNHTCKQCRGK